MPEGDYIHRLAAELGGRVVGRTVRRSIFRHPRLATLDLAGRTLVGAESNGKHLFLHFDDGWSLHLHLLMDGRLSIGGRVGVEEWRRRFELDLAGPDGSDGGLIRLTGVDVPLLHLVRTDDAARMVEHLGPDLCGRFGPAQVELAVARIEADPSAPLAGALLDQRNVAGFGNVYAVEVPFVCGVSPFRPIGGLTGLGELVTVGAALIRTNAALGPMNTTGRRLATADHWILGGRVGPCPRCGTVTRQLSGDRCPWGRRTVWCPECQPESGAGADAVDVARARRLLGLHPARRLLTFEGVGVTLTGSPDPVVVRPARGRPGPAH